jgi:nicotinamidase-related amidase
MLSMADELTLDRAHSALLVMDYQNDMVANVEATHPGLLDRAATVLEVARTAPVLVVYVVVRFRPGYPEISRRNRTFASINGTGRMVEGTPGAEIHTRVAPRDGDVVVTKRRVGAFGTTDLDAVLRAHEVTTLLLMGIATSGVVLSTVRWAADLDYELVVVADCCADRDAEVHRVLTEKVFPRQASVVPAETVRRALHRAAGA